MERGRYGGEVATMGIASAIRLQNARGEAASSAVNARQRFLSHTAWRGEARFSCSELYAGSSDAAQRRRRLLRRSVPALIAFIAGCSPTWYEADADREVHALLEQYDQRVLGTREREVIYPEEAPPEDEPGSTAAAAEEAAPPAEPLPIDLPTALELAFTTSRDFQDQKESLYLQGLGYSLTRYNFGPLLNSTISYLWRDSEDARGIDSLTATASAGSILPTGGDLSVASTWTGTRDDDPDVFGVHGDPFFDSSLQVSLRQPLLRGAGYEVSHEALTQGERNLVYAVRAFELFRQDFCIRVVSAYYNLVSRKMRLENDERNYRDAVFDRKKAEALRQVDRYRDDDVFLARRREIEAEDALLVSRTEYELAVDDFKILIGLPTSAKIFIGDDEPAFKPVRIDPQSAVTVAHHNRLDLHTERDQLEDAERRIRLARNGLLPDLDLSVNYALDGRADRIHRAAPDEWSGSLGVALDLPVDRKSERNAYRSALIFAEQSRRDYRRRLDEVERDILNQVRELGQLEKRIQLQRDQIKREERAVAVTQIRYESGDVQTRDLLDARQGLTNARNALIELKVQHFIARLRLLRDMGVFFVDDNGMWRR
jgi:outer membrane protein TolC